MSLAASAPAGPLRLAELLASVSLATDLGTGQPLGHALRTCTLAVRTGPWAKLASSHHEQLDGRSPDADSGVAADT